MTRNDDIERVLDQWFTEGPVGMSDRMFYSTLDRIDRLPRGRLADLQSRLPTMTRNVRLAAAAALIIVLAGAGLAVLGRVPSVGPSPSATPDPASEALTSLLPAKWTSVGVRTWPIGVPPLQEQVSIVFRDTTLAIDQFKGDVSSFWSVLQSRQLQIVMRDQQFLESQHWACKAGDVGIYTAVVADTGNMLTLSSNGDACRTRQTLLDGAWDRWPCENPLSVCEPVLTPGRHASEVFAPMGRLSFQVPAGWSITADYATEFDLGRPNDKGDVGIHVTPDVVAHTQAANCPDAPEPDIAPTSIAIATWLAGLTSLVATTPRPIVVDGNRGQVLDLSVLPNFTQACQFYDAPSRVVVTLTDAGATPEGGVTFRTFLTDDTHSTYVLVDLKNGHNLLIEVTGPDEASWLGLLAEAMPIVESFEFIQ